MTEIEMLRFWAFSVSKCVAKQRKETQSGSIGRADWLFIEKTRVPKPPSPEPAMKIHVRQWHHSNQRIWFHTCQTASVFPYLTAHEHTSLHLPPYCSATTSPSPPSRAGWLATPVPIGSLRRTDDAWRSARHAVGGAWQRRPDPTNDQSEEYGRADWPFI